MEKAYLCTITKDEGVDLVEWLLFHLAIGFDKIIVYDNDSNDKTRELVSICQDFGDIEYKYWPYSHGQLSAYADCLAHFGKKCDWMCFLDVDEFLVLSKHKYVKAFMEEVTKFQAIAINWRVFGSNNEKTIKPALIIDTFVRRAPDSFSANRHIKSFVRPHFASAVINPHYIKLKRTSWYSLERFRYFSPEGETIRWLKPGKRVSTGEVGIAQINHYFTKSREHYDKKLLRGNADSGNKRKDVFDFNDRNEVLDTKILDLYFHEIEIIRDLVSTIRRSGPL